MHVVIAGVFHHIDVEAVAPQRARQRAGIVDRLGQRRVGVGIMTVADHERDPRSLVLSIAALLGRDGLRGIERSRVQPGVGADRQRRHTGQSDGKAIDRREKRGCIAVIVVRFQLSLWRSCDRLFHLG